LRYGPWFDARLSGGVVKLLVLAVRSEGRQQIPIICDRVTFPEQYSRYPVTQPVTALSEGLGSGISPEGTLTLWDSLSPRNYRTLTLPKTPNCTMVRHSFVPTLCPSSGGRRLPQDAVAGSKKKAPCVVEVKGALSTPTVKSLRSYHRRGCFARTAYTQTQKNGPPSFTVTASRQVRGWQQRHPELAVNGGRCVGNTAEITSASLFAMLQEVAEPGNEHLVDGAITTSVPVARDGAARPTITQLF
jgi:hypothetical protein